MSYRKEPGAAHHALMTDLRGVVDRFDAQGMPGVERIAVLAQLIGAEIHRLPKDVPYGPDELLASVAGNITAGNEAARGRAPTNGGLLGLGGVQ